LAAIYGPETRRLPIADQRSRRLRGVELIGLVRQKLAVPGNEPVDVSANRLAALRQKLGSQLQPVLRAADFADFDMERVFQVVAATAARVT
jgi:hypothetical protein